MINTGILDKGKHGIQNPAKNGVKKPGKFCCGTWNLITISILAFFLNDQDTKLSLKLFHILGMTFS